MKTVFVVGGSPTARKPRQPEPTLDDRVIAADRGAEHARRWGWPVHLLVGDLDSLHPMLADTERKAGTRVVLVPAAKDQTDLEMGLEYGLAEQPDRLIICGALGGRTDHLLANVLLLARSDLAGWDVSLADGNETVRMLSSHPGRTDRIATLTVHGQVGDLLTLLPATGDATGVSTNGLKYPLRNETLSLGEARGTSNVFEQADADIRLHEGSLLVVHVAKE